MPNASEMLERVRECEAVVFDLDDTLYLEREYVRSGARAVGRWLAGALGLDPVLTSAELGETAARNPTGDPFGRWLRARRLNAERWLPEVLERYRAHVPAIRLEPGIERLLTRLGRRRKLGIVSDGRFSQQRLKVEALGLDRRVSAIVLSDELGRDAWKPCPRPYQLALELLGESAGRAVYVADNPAKDFLGARRAHMLSVRLRRRGGLHSHREPAEDCARPDLEARNLSELTRILCGRRT
ncbi:MAG: HAD-IA family hydrolase [Acidobacteria bacterium]|nr:HAD-IA family hydrolase [Acidobacteriota bacterium]